jgi:hypothetical protein
VSLQLFCPGLLAVLCGGGDFVGRARSGLGGAVTRTVSTCIVITITTLG